MIYRMAEVLELNRKFGIFEAARLSYRIREQEIAKAWTWPNRIFTGLFGVTYYIALFITSLFVRQANLEPRISKVVRDLAARYYYIPEIVIFKALELEAVCRHPISGRVLDLGCGTGITGASVKENSGIRELFGIDRVSNLVAKDEYAGYCVGDGGALPFRDASFDHVITLGVLDHIPEIDQTLRECARVLQPGGSILFAIQTYMFRESTFWFKAFSKLMPKGELAGKFQTYRDVYDMIFHYRSEGQWREKLIEAGFRRIEIDYVFPARNLFFYDLMNIQTYFLRFFFADRAKQFLDRHPFLRRLVIEATTRISERLMETPVNRDNATRYFLRAFA